MRKLYTILLLLAPMVFTSKVALAQDADEWYGVNDLFEGSNPVRLGNRDLRETIAGIINVVLGFLGVIAVIIVLLGGFKWMTSQGNTEKVDEAKKLIGAGIVGIVIVLAAFAIASFVLTELYNQLVE